MKVSTVALFVSAALSAGGAAAADVTVYGAIDTGLSYTDTKHGSDSLVMSSGQYAGPRFGLKGGESLGDGYEVRFILENGFQSDTGRLDADGKMFNRESLVSVVTPYGTFGAGRTGPFTSGTGSLSRYWDLEPFETGYTDAGIQATQVNIWSRHSNTIYYLSPKFSGLELGGQYSFSGNNETEINGMAKDNHFANVFGRWDGESLHTALGVELDTIGHSYQTANTPDKDRWSVKLAVRWDVANDLALYAGGNAYFNQAKLSDVTWNEDTGIRFDNSGKGLTGYAGYLGARVTSGAADWLASVQYLKGQNKGALTGDEDDFQRYVASIGVHYHFSGRTMGYAVASWSDGDGMLNRADTTVNRTCVQIGMTHFF